MKDLLNQPLAVGDYVININTPRTWEGVNIGTVLKFTEHKVQVGWPLGWPSVNLCQPSSLLKLTPEQLTWCLITRTT